MSLCYNDMPNINYSFSKQNLKQYESHLCHVKLINGSNAMCDHREQFNGMLG